jgi:MFS transporter, FSR family, fosmidomycin resistance protein
MRTPREKPGPKTPRAPSTAEEDGQEKDGARDDWRMFGWLTVVVTARSVTYFGVSSLIALFLVDRFGVSKELGSAALTAFTGAGIIGTVFGGWLADRAGRVRTARLGYALTLPALLVLVLSPSVAVAFPAALLLGLGVYIPFSVHITLGQEYLPTRPGTASGVTVGLTVSIGGITAPFLGALADTRGLSTALAVLMTAPIVSLLASTRLKDTHKHAQGEQQGTAHVI